MDSAYGWAGLAVQMLALVIRRWAWGALFWQERRVRRRMQMWCGRMVLFF